MGPKYNASTSLEDWGQGFVPEGLPTGNTRQKFG